MKPRLVLLFVGALLGAALLGVAATGRASTHATIVLDYAIVDAGKGKTVTTRRAEGISNVHRGKSPNSICFTATIAPAEAVVWTQPIVTDSIPRIVEWREKATSCGPNELEVDIFKEVGGKLVPTPNAVFMNSTGG